MTIMEMSVLDMKGDTKITWDSNNTAEVDNARRSFDSLRAQGFTAHVTGGKKGNRKAETMDDFDPSAESLIMAPPMVGG